jgi:hypothetical protein
MQLMIHRTRFLMLGRGRSMERLALVKVAIMGQPGVLLGRLVTVPLEQLAMVRLEHLKTAPSEHLVMVPSAPPAMVPSALVVALEETVMSGAVGAVDAGPDHRKIGQRSVRTWEDGEKSLAGGWGIWVSSLEDKLV